LTLDLSLNPDFAQVDADRLILNLTNYERELPEKRPFFLEGRDVFAMPLPLFYSRRIGRVAPPSPELRETDALVDPTKPAALLGAQKLVGRIADRTSVGALSALTGRNDVKLRDAAGTERNSPVEARTAFHVLRLKREVGSNGHLGVMATAVTRGEDTTAYTRDIAGAPNGRDVVVCPDGSRVAEGRRCFHDAYVGAADGRWRSSNGDWTANGLVLGSAIREGPARRLRDGTVIGSGDTGIGGIGHVAKEGGVPWVGELEFETESRRLDFNDAGLMRRQNQRVFTAILEYRTLAPWFVTLETHTQFEFFARRNLSDLRLDEAYKLRTTWKFRNFWDVQLEAHYRRSFFDDREVGNGTALERGALAGLITEIKTDPRRRVNAEVYLETDRVFDGYSFLSHATVTVRALPQFDITVGPELIYAAGEPRFAGREAGSLVFGRLEAGNISTTLRTTYTFTPRISLQTYTQLFLAAGHYSSFGSVVDPGVARTVLRSDLVPSPGLSSNPDFSETALNMNIVLRWEYLLGSSVFLVYTRLQAPSIQLAPGQRGIIDASGLGRAPATDTLLLKLSHFFG
ncbi:MAG TPA: DUF5916 domain-containing protein, partial [Labilithrix sp.]|nr:DUF5916 domain-containing protein [Labilithrix sp.]